MSETVTAEPEGIGAQQVAPETPVAAPSEPVTMRDTASAVFDAIEAREAEAAGERGPDGRFLPKPNDGAPTEAAQPERLAPPEGFADKALVDWNRLPRSVQEGILARVDAAPPAPPPDPFVETARGLRGAFEQHGLIPERALPEIVNAWQQLVANPREVLPALAKQFGVELGQPAPAAGQEQGSPWVDPEIAALKSELAELKNQSEQRNRQEQAERAAAEHRVQRETLTELQTFSKDKPDFEALRQHMAALLQTGAAKDLQDAYDKAAWANPQTRAARIEAERKADEQKRVAEAEKARKAALVNVRSDGRGAPAPARSIRETMERAYDGLQSA